MADSPLALLAQNQQVTQNLFAQLNSNIMGAAQLRQRDTEFNKTIDLQYSQLAQEGALKNAQLDEQRRMNTLEATNLQFRNGLAERQFQYDMQLAPLKIQTARLGVENQKLENELRMNQLATNQFNQITKTYDEAVGSLLAQNQDPALGQAYLGIKAEEQGNIMQGKQFDPNIFGTRVNELLTQYKDTPTIDTYNPQTTELLVGLGATTSAQKYERKNPVYLGSATGIKTGILLGGQDAFIKNNNQLSGLGLDDKEIGTFANQVFAYQGYGDTINQLEKNQNQLLEGFSRARTPEERNSIGAQLNSIDSRIKSTKEAQQKVYQDALGIAPPPVATSEQDQSRLAARAAIQQDMQILDRVPSPAGKFDVDAELRNYQATNSPKILKVFDKELAGMSYRYLTGQNVRTRPEDIQAIRSNVVRNIDQMDDKELDEKIQNLGNNEDFRTTFGKLKGRPVTVPNSNFPITYGERNAAQSLFSAAGFGQSDATVSNFDDISQLIKDYDQAYPNQPAKKRQFLESLYADLVTATFVESLSGK